MRKLTPQRYGVLVIVVSIYLVLAGNGGMFLLVVGLKQIAQDFDWPRSVPSLAYSFLFIGTGIGGIIMGYWFDRSGPGPVTLLGVVMIGAGTMLTSMIDASWQLYAIYGVMIGLLGQATIFGPLVVNAMRWFEHRRGLVVGLVAAGQGVAGTIWPPTFRHFNETVGWRETFLWYGVFVLVTALPLNAVLWRRTPARTLAQTGAQSETSEDAQSDGVGQSSAPPSASPTPQTPSGLPPWMLQTALCLAITGCCISMSMPVAHLVAHASDLGHATARAAEMLAVALFAATITRVMGGALIVDRFGGLVGLLIFSGTQTLALALYAMVDGLVVLYLVSSLFGIGYGGISICYPVIVREQLPAAESGRRLGIVLLFGAFGMALGGGMAGYIFDLTGSYTPAFITGAAFNVANLVIVLGLISRNRCNNDRGSVRAEPSANPVAA